MPVDPSKMLIASARPELARVLGVADLDRRTSKLERRQVNTLVAARLAPWTPATLQGPWVNEGGTETTAAYYIDAAGFVHLKGSIKAYLAPPTGALVPPPLQPSVCTTLPVGYRPSERYTFPTPLSYDAGYDGSGAVIAGINGTITIEDRSNYGGVSSGGVGAPSDPDTVHVNLDGILFRT